MRRSSSTAVVVADEEDNKPEEICEYARFNSSSMSDSSTADEQEYDELEALVDTTKRTLYGNERKMKQVKDDELFLWHTNWLPDGPWKIGKVQLLDYPSVKLFKFFFVTIGMMLIVHYYAILANAKRDATYTLREMVLYDGNHIILDIIVFFVVGRLYGQKSVDNLAFIVPTLWLAISVSLLASNSEGVDHSITPYEMRCSWGWEMWALVGLFGFPLTVGLVTIHFVHAFRNGFASQKLVELSVTLLLFLAPYTQSSFLHLHHWYFAWFLGMHANATDVWWSRLTMSLLWGLYINGVAIFGRDPIMTCAVTLYQSQNQECPYLVAEEEFTFEALVASVDGSVDCSSGP